MAKFAVASLDQIEQIDDGRVPFRAVRRHFGISTFGINAMTAHALGDPLINEHSDPHEELYLVIAGSAAFELDGETHNVPAGSFLHVAPGVKRSAIAADLDTTVVVIGAGLPGQVYTPDNWEEFAVLLPLFKEGRFAEGADRAVAMLESGEFGGTAYYNTACFEARAGRIEAALQHLRRGLEMSPDLREWAREDEDLAALHGNPEYEQIVGG